MIGQKPAIPDSLEAGKFRSAPKHQLERKNWSTTVGNKELYIIPGAVHTALYDDRAGVIPYDKMEEFFAQYLK